MTDEELLTAIEELFGDSYTLQLVSPIKRYISEYDIAHTTFVAIAKDSNMLRIPEGGLDETGTPYHGDTHEALLAEVRKWVHDNMADIIVWRVQPAVYRDGTSLKVRFRGHTLSKAAFDKRALDRR